MEKDPRAMQCNKKRSKARKSGGKDGGNVGAEADNKYNGLPQEQGDLVQRTLKIMRNIWLSSKSLQRFNQERHGMNKIGESAMILAKTLRLEGKYWQQDDSELSSKLAGCANMIEPEVENGEKSEKTDDATEINKNFDPLLQAFDILQSSLSRRIKKMHEDNKASKASNEARLLELETAHATLQRDLQSKDEAIKELGENLNSITEEKNKLQASEADWRKKGEEMQREISRVNSESESLKQSAADKDLKIAKLEEDIKTVDGQRVESEKTMMAMKENQTTLESLNESLKKQLETSGEEQQAIEKMQSELAATKGKLEAARLDSERVSKDMEKMEEVRARLEEELSQSQIALSTSKSQCQDWEQKTMASEQNLKRLQEEHLAMSEKVVSEKKPSRHSKLSWKKLHVNVEMRKQQKQKQKRKLLL